MVQQLPNRHPFQAGQQMTVARRADVVTPTGLEPEHLEMPVVLVQSVLVGGMSS
jgi:hypothetical protein